MSNPVILAPPDPVATARGILKAYDLALALANDGHTDAAITLGMAKVTDHGLNVWLSICRALVDLADREIGVAR